MSSSPQRVAKLRSTIANPSRWRCSAASCSPACAELSAGILVHAPEARRKCVSRGCRTVTNPCKSSCPADTELAQRRHPRLTSIRVPSRAVLARVATFAIDGVEPRQVSVEVDIRPGLPAFTIVGLGDAAVRESRERVRAAILNSGFEFPQRRITANLAPAFMRKAGPGFDAAMALAVLAASGQLSRPGTGRRRRVRRAVARRRAARLRRCARGRGGCAPSRHSQPDRAAGARERGGARRGPVDPRCQRPSRRGRCRDRQEGARPTRTASCQSAATPTRSRRRARSRRSRCWRFRSRRRELTTCCSRARPAPARRCSPAGCRRSCRR